MYVLCWTDMQTGYDKYSISKAHPLNVSQAGIGLVIVEISFYEMKSR
jgi:hypothetical protein